MTREELIDIFEHNWTRLENHDYTEEELNCALTMAIKALKQESKVDLDELKRKILMELDGGTDDKWLKYCDVCDRISESIDTYKAESEDKE